MEDSNPYRSPTATEDAILDTAALVELAKEWEKLRLIYNGILILPGLIILGMWVGLLGYPLPLAIFSGIFVGVGANVAFFLGPLAELYFRAFLRNGKSLGGGRKILFRTGIVFSLLVMFPPAVIPLVASGW